jgi:hypothetical protein
MKRCLVLSCSQAKQGEAPLLPALERYDGPAFRVVRRFLREAPSELQNVDVFILSAEYGMIAADQQISDYDRRMTHDRALELREQICSTIREKIAPVGYSEIFISLGRDYRAALNGCQILQSVGNVVLSRAPLAKKLTELKAWLYGTEVETSRRREPTPAVVLPEGTKVQVVIRGVEIEMSRVEVLATARHALDSGEGNPANYRRWYVQVDDRRVSPKWLVSLLSGLPVSAFAADEARRVLRQFGVEVYRNE